MGVTIIDYKQRESKDGEVFNALILQGEIETVQSQETGEFYFTARKASVPSTFDERVCQGLIGKKMSGQIERVPSEPYEYFIEETGDTVMLNHTYEYNPKPVTTEEQVFEGEMAEA